MRRFLKGGKAAANLTAKASPRAAMGSAAATKPDPTDAANPRSLVAAKLRSAAGETIAEVLVSVLIVGLATVLFATMVSVATTTSSKGIALTQQTYRQVSAVDDGSSAAGTGTVTVTGSGIGTSFEVDTVTSAPDEGESGYSFTRYALPADADEAGGA